MKLNYTTSQSHNIIANRAPFNCWEAWAQRSLWVIDTVMDPGISVRAPPPFSSHYDLPSPPLSPLIPLPLNLAMHVKLPIPHRLVYHSQTILRYGYHCRQNCCRPTNDIVSTQHSALANYNYGLQWRTEGGWYGVRTPPLTWQIFCWYFNHTECVKIVFSTKILKKNSGDTAPSPVGRGHPSHTPPPSAPRPPPC